LNGKFKEFRRQSNPLIIVVKLSEATLFHELGDIKSSMEKAFYQKIETECMHA